MKRYIVFVILLVLLLGVTACGKKSQEKKTETLETPSVEATATITESVTETPTEAPVTPAPWENATNRVTFVTVFFYSISEENQGEINRLLYEKGIDCRIDFVCYPVTEESGYEAWLEKYEEKNGPVDILSSGVWDHFSLGAEFAEQRFLPIDEYLQSAEGQALKDSYGEAEWRKVTVSGHIYSIPKSKRDLTDIGLYMAVNGKYADYFNSFDGTYESLEKVYGEIGNPELKVVFEDGFGEDELTAFLGYKTVYYAGTYDALKKRAENVFEDGRLAETLRKVYAGFERGILINSQFEEAEPEQILARVYMGTKKTSDGFAEYCLMPDTYETNATATYGVNKASTQADLALRVLSACYSDPAIASLIDWGESDPEAWKEKQDLLRQAPLTELTDFSPQLTDSEKLNLKDYSKSIMALCSEMYLYAPGSDTHYLNPDYEDVIEEYLDGGDAYREGTDALNRELGKWFDQ